MAEEKWLTAMEAAQWLGRSVHTIYTWIRQTKIGTASHPLKMKPRPGYGREQRQSWLLESESLLVIHGQSSNIRRPPAKIPTAKVKSPADTIEAVEADRRKWVQAWVAEGKQLDKVLSVFDSRLHAEIEWYYRQAVRKKGQGKINPSP